MSNLPLERGAKVVVTQLTFSRVLRYLEVYFTHIPRDVILSIMSRSCHCVGCHCQLFAGEDVVLGSNTGFVEHGFVHEQCARGSDVVTRSEMTWADIDALCEKVFAAAGRPTPTLPALMKGPDSPLVPRKTQMRAQQRKPAFVNRPVSLRKI